MNAERGFALRLLGERRHGVIAGWQKGQELNGLGRECFLHPATSVSVMEYWGEKQ